MSRRSGRSCAVIGCYSNSKRLQQWKKSVCETHRPLLKEDCPCCRPYGLHRFPGRTEDKGIRLKWIKNINRKDFIPNKNSMVCGIHFPDGRPTKKHPYPVLNMGYGHPWKNWGLPRREPASNRGSTRLGHEVCPDLPLEQPVPCEEEAKEEIAAVVVMTEHDYGSAPKPGALDAAAACIEQLEDKIKELTTELSKLKVCQVYFHRFCVSDKDILFYTRFTSRDVFCHFWEAIQPSASMVVYWSKAQKKGQTFEPISPNPTRRLQLIDEFFLFCCRVAAGLQEKVLADMFQVSVSTVSRVVITWASYLYLLLGSLPIWMNKQQVRNTMPSEFVKYSPNVRVIINCIEVRCQNPPSLTLQPEIVSSYKNMSTLKGLIGIAPCGAVTFVSSLFTSSISDRELTERSGLLDLLEPGDGCMADKSFTIEKLLGDRGATLIIPPFKLTAQFTKEDALKTQAIARLQILVERAIRRVKEYCIWEHTLPLTLSGTVNQLWTVCCLMTNFQGPIDLKGYNLV